jgi:BolA protein
MERSDRLKQHLEQAFQPIRLEITDDSHLHAGHQHGGGGHYSVTLCSERFEGCSTLERHRMVYAALGSMMLQDIHALSIKAASPSELG